MEYKIEKKPTTWHILLYRGAYSDYEEGHWFIYANSPEEAWMFFKEYAIEHEIADRNFRIFYGEDKIVTKEWIKSEYHDIDDPCNEYSDWQVGFIQMLEVIHVHSIY